VWAKGAGNLRLNERGQSWLRCKTLRNLLLCFGPFKPVDSGTDVTTENRCSQIHSKKTIHQKLHTFKIYTLFNENVHELSPRCFDLFYAHLCRRFQFRKSYIDRLIVHVYMFYHRASSHLVTNAVKRSKTDLDKPRWIYWMCPSSTWLQAGKPFRLRQPWLTRQTSQ